MPHSDHSHLPDDSHLPDHVEDRSIPPAHAQWPADLPPTLEQDLAAVAWLETNQQQLSPECTDYLCGALLEWSMLGGLWPDPAEPIAGPECDHLEALVQITERWVDRAQAEPIGRRLQLARVGRELGTAIRCQRDPEGLAESRWRERVHRQPWLAGPPTPIVLADGRVL